MTGPDADPFRYQPRERYAQTGADFGDLRIGPSAARIEVGSPARDPRLLSADQLASCAEIISGRRDTASNVIGRLLTHVAALTEQHTAAIEKQGVRIQRVFDELAKEGLEIARLTIELERARATAVALEQELALRDGDHRRTNEARLVVARLDDRNGR